MARKTNSPPRERRRNANRERILDAAAEQVADEGVHALSIKRVAELSDYTPGALYRYFSSKDALLAAVVVRAMEQLVETVAEERNTTSPLERIAAIALAYRRFAMEAPQVFALLSTMMGESRVLIADEDEAQKMAKTAQQALVPLVAAFNDASVDGTFPPGHMGDRALVLWSALQGSLQLRKYERVAAGIIDVDRLSMTTIRVQLCGFGADPQLVDAAIKACSPDASTG